MKTKFYELLDKDVFVDGDKIAKIKDVIIDTDEWKITHLEIELNKKAAREIVGVKKEVRNTLAISALEKGMACCSDAGVEIKVSKGQLPIYLRSA
ncbi:MAG: PRC-barrel domain-containing protein [Candidatus Bathyarchaeota archaeon]|nr:PRC-barrel domain-containing protein [Candidatus Bathyarchaeota archaeon]